MAGTADRNQRRLETRGKTILEAAAVEFAESGYDRPRLIGSVAVSACPKAGLFHYVGSKEELLVDLANAGSRR